MRIVIFLSVAWTVFFLLHLVVYVSAQRVYTIDIPYQYVWVGALAALYFIASALTRRYHYPLVRTLYTLAAIWVGVVWLLFAATFLYEIFFFVSGNDAPLLHSTLLTGAVLLSIVALRNGQSLAIREYTLPIPHLTTPLRIAHLSDIHVGTVHQESFLNRVVTLTNSAHPDIVLITGDLFDGSAPIDEAILRPLDALTTPAYFSTGNHEGYEGLDQVRTTVGHLNLTLLENQAVMARGVRIVGVHDRQNLALTATLDGILSALPVPPQPAPTILMYHTPVEWETARRHGVALMLSGHTHNGQIFPFMFLVRLFFRYVNGLYEKDGAYLHVSPGTGTWGPPMRLGSRNQVTILNLTPVGRGG